MQKLLVPAGSTRVLRQGDTSISGPVVRADDVAAQGATDLVRAHGLLRQASPFGRFERNSVDVIRFVPHPLMRLERPRPAGGESFWPTYDDGLLHEPARVPVWYVEPTRVPVGAQLWRIFDDGRQQQLSTFLSLAQGWHDARQYRPPLRRTGTRARWRGHDLPAEFTADRLGVELVWLGDDDVPEGFESVRPGVHRRLVALADCDAVVDVAYTARWQGVPVRVVQRYADTALALLADPDNTTAEGLRARLVEPASYELTAPFAELTDLTAVSTELPPGWTPDGASADTPPAPAVPSVRPVTDPDIELPDLARVYDAPPPGWPAPRPAPKKPRERDLSGLHAALARHGARLLGLLGPGDHASEVLAEEKLVHVWQTGFGGSQILVGEDGGVLFGTSALGRDAMLEAWRSGRRTALREFEPRS